MYSSSTSILSPFLLREKTQVSFVIRDKEEQRHKNGVSSLQLDPVEGRLYSAGRDGIIRVWNTAPGVQNRYLQSFEHHADWVNDIVLCCGGTNLISASSDMTVKLCYANNGRCISTVQSHKDYVRALAYAKDKEQIASAGLDKTIFLWDVDRLKLLTNSNSKYVLTTRLFGNEESIYSLAMNPPGTIIVSGSTEKVLRVWDPRDRSQLMDLEGHSDTVKALVVSRDGTQCVSGSSDGTIKLWSLAQQSCVLTIRVHSQAVWALLASENFTHIISGGRDRLVIITELRHPENFIIICEETAPILKLCFTTDQQGIWVSTSESDIRCWKLPPHDSTDTVMYNQNEYDTNNVYQTQPIHHISGGPAIKRFEVLNDKRHILTKDSANHVALYDVLKASKIEDLGEVDFEEEVKKRFKMIYVPSWFKVDLKTGMLTIHLSQDDCLSAWISAEQAGLTTKNDQEVNYGALLLQALFKYWIYWNFERRLIMKPERPIIRNTFFTVPLHTPLFFNELGVRNLYNLQVGEAYDADKGSGLMSNIPFWAADVAVELKAPNKNMLSFFLLPHASCPSNQDQQEVPKVGHYDFIQCRKLAEHLLKKIVGRSSATQGSAKEDNGNDPLEEKVELLCKDKVLDLNMDLRTVHHFIWNSNEDFTIHYRILKQ